jgi:small subunit ribosomal protein S1
LLIDPEKERISLGIKQLSDQPAASNVVKKGEIVTCEIVEVNPEFLRIKLSDDSEGVIKKIDISSDRKEQRAERFAVGDRVDAKIISVDKKGEVNLSIKQLEIDQNKQAIKDFGSSDSGATLGDILGAALNKAGS